MSSQQDHEPSSELLTKIAGVKPISDFYDHTYISLRNKYMFHTIGKAANSTVKHVFYQMELRERGAPMPSVHDRAASPLLSPYQLDEATLNRVLFDPEFTRFTFARDPYSRLLSCYLDRLADHKSRPYRQLMRTMRKRPGYSPTFAEFIETICAQTHFAQNNHWRLQHADALADLITYDFIGRQETFGADIDAIASRISGSTLENISGETNASPAKTSSENRLKDFWSRDLVRLVQDAFAPDFAWLGYAAEPAWLDPPVVAVSAPVLQTNLPPADLPPVDPEALPTRRAVRLKEFGTNIQRILTPTPQYLRQTNGTIAEEAYRLETDPDGFILASGHRSRSGDRTYVLGDSFIECSFVQEGSRICDLMNTQLGQQPGVVLNGGYSGSTTLNILNGLINRVLPRSPRNVIFALPSNDVLALIEHGGFWNLRDKRYSPIMPIENRVTGTNDFEANAAALAPLLALFCQTAREFSFNLTLTTMPFVSTDYQKLGWFRIRHQTEDVYEALVTKRHHVNAILRETAKAQGVNLIDLAALLTPDLFYDDVHMNAQGCRAVADLLMPALAKD